MSLQATYQRTKHLENRTFPATSTHIVPGRGTPDFKWQGWSNWTKIEKSKPKKSLHLKLTPQKSHTKFLSLKNLWKGKQVWLYFNRRTTQPGCVGTIRNLQIVLNSQKSLIKSSHPPSPQNTCKILLPSFLRSFLSLGIWFTHPPPPPTDVVYIGLFITLPFTPSLLDYNCQISCRFCFLLRSMYENAFLIYWLFWEFLSVRPSLEKKIWDFLDRLLAIPFSLFFQRLSYIFADLSQNSHVSAHSYNLVLILPHHYGQFSHVPCASSENDFPKSFYCFYANGIIFLPHMSNQFLICDYSWTKKSEKLKCLEAVVKLRRQRGKCVFSACLNILQVHSCLI